MFAERLAWLKAGESYRERARKMQDAGLKVTPQALRKWTHGGGISPENVKAVARYFDVSPGNLYIGETDESSVEQDDGV